MQFCGGQAVLGVCIRLAVWLTGPALLWAGYKCEDLEHKLFWECFHPTGLSTVSSSVEEIKVLGNGIFRITGKLGVAKAKWQEHIRGRAEFNLEVRSCRGQGRPFFMNMRASCSGKVDEHALPIRIPSSGSSLPGMESSEAALPSLYFGTIQDAVQDLPAPDASDGQQSSMRNLFSKGHGVRGLVSQPASPSKGKASLQDQKAPAGCLCCIS
eukprot:jgi/Botrbrau1/108/Bobra.0022s0097.1